MEGQLNRTPSKRRNKKELNKIQLGQPAQCVRLYLFVPSLLEVMVVMTILPTTEVLADGTLGKGHMKGKVKEGRAKAMTQLLTSSTCRNRYIYGWRVCTVTYFPCPLKQGNDSFNLHSNSVSQLSSLHLEREIQVFFAHYHV